MGSSHSTKSADALAERLVNCDIVDDAAPKFPSLIDPNEETEVSSFFVSTYDGTSETSDAGFSAQYSGPDKPSKSVHSTILIFDLDDTLIPTEWIRSSFAAQKHMHATTDEVYQVGQISTFEQYLV